MDSIHIQTHDPRCCSLWLCQYSYLEMESVMENGNHASNLTERIVLSNDWFYTSLRITHGHHTNCRRRRREDTRCHLFKTVSMKSAGLLFCLLVAYRPSNMRVYHNFTCCHTEIEAADQTFHLTQSQYTDTGPTSPSADPITPGAWQGSHWSANF